ncbi:ABC transporter ATP-binding protein [Sphingomonas sp. 1P06PA]|uniref:ABC transporter ATP-binding protein n=1 Tax=Sphingomonas sp. 1P06PA TaxID=554121 RepID=UPI0039A64648
MTRLVARALQVEGRLQATDLDLDRGKLVAVVGVNGAGKTSLLHAIAGVAGSGDVAIDGVALDRLPPARRLRALAFAPAGRAIAWPLAARDVVALGLGATRDPAAVEAALALVDGRALADRRADRLSTGERARILLARALVARPAVLLLDEPVANLDPRRQIETMALLRAEADRGAAVVAAIHDLALARVWADRVLVVDGGRIVADGPAADALSDQAISRWFGVTPGASGWMLTDQAG